MKKRVCVAMSGGVDSSTAAYLLKEQGYELFGITMNFDGFLNPRNAEDARKAAKQLGMEHYIVNMGGALEDNVIRDFCSQYLKGRTPNPCIRCNKFIKFGALLKEALSLGADYFATGHYARIVRRQNTEDRNQKYLLKKAKDKAKDQSYFLYRLSQNQLRYIIFPLGNYLKAEIRSIAQRIGLRTADRLPSQEICFLSGTDYRGFLEKRIGRQIKPGNIVDTQGNILGTHNGIALYTVGQREGLGIAKGYPLYVTKLDSRRNLVVVGRKDEAFSGEFVVKDPNFISRPIKKKVALKVRIRYNHKEVSAQAAPYKDKIKVAFRKAQFAITPGQSAVFYDKDTVIGGGIIDEVLR
jgi:tRNA-uridine 2-sulfurtransferase